MSPKKRHALTRNKTVHTKMLEEGLNSFLEGLRDSEGALRRLLDVCLKYIPDADVGLIVLGNKKTGFADRVILRGKLISDEDERAELEGTLKDERLFGEELLKPFFETMMPQDGLVVLNKTRFDRQNEKVEFKAKLVRGKEIRGERLPLQELPIPGIPTVLNFIERTNQILSIGLPEVKGSEVCGFFAAMGTKQLSIREVFEPLEASRILVFEAQRLLTSHEQYVIQERSNINIDLLSARLLRNRYMTRVQHIIEYVKRGKGKLPDLENLLTEVLRLDEPFSERRILRYYIDLTKKKCPNELETLKQTFIRALKGSGQEKVSGFKHIKVLVEALTDSGKKQKSIGEIISVVEEVVENSRDFELVNKAILSTQDIFLESNTRNREQILDNIRKTMPKLPKKCVANVVELLGLAVQEGVKVNEALGLIKELCKNNPDILSLVVRILEIVRFILPGETVSEFLNSLRLIEGIEGRQINQAERAFEQAQDERLYIESKVHRDEGKELPIKFISVVSQKGGSGKSTVALGLALLLDERLDKENEEKVCIIELDFAGPTFGFLPLQNGKYYLNDYLYQYRDSSAPKKDRLKISDIVWKLEGTNVSVVPCALSRTQQASMAYIDSNEFLDNTAKFKIYDIARYLASKKYKYVIFDTPAELRSLTLTACYFTHWFKGTNLFVTTLFGPGLYPLIDTLLAYHFSQARNYILFNMVLEDQADWVKDKKALLDYLSCVPFQSGTLQSRTDKPCLLSRPAPPIHSEAILARWLHSFEDCYRIPYEEILARFLRGKPRDVTLSILKKRLKKFDFAGLERIVEAHMT